MNKGAKLVSEALLGRDFVTVVVDGKAYTVHPPTIKRISGAASHLSCMGDEKTFADIVKSLSNLDEATKSLSWFIKGDESLNEELSNGTFDEVVQALELCFSMVSVECFTKLSVLAKNVAELTAKPK